MGHFVKGQENGAVVVPASPQRTILQVHKFTAFFQVEPCVCGCLWVFVGVCGVFVGGLVICGVFVGCLWSVCGLGWVFVCGLGACLWVGCL